MGNMTRLKNIIRQSYDEQASIYSSRKLLQTSNLKRLLTHLFEQPGCPKSGRLLDVGCGDGVLLDVLNQTFKRLPYQYSGMDLSPGMIREAKSGHPEDVEFYVGDAEKLDSSNDSIDLVVSNSVLHWLNDPVMGHTLRKALSEIYRVLVPNGMAAISISGAGTAARFLTAFNEVRRGNSLNPSEIRKDPIGSMALHRVVDDLLELGFSIDLAHLEYEPKVYANPMQYAEHVRAYGYEMFLDGVPVESKESVWNSIVERFESICGKGAYIHDQYMNYLIVTKHLNADG